MEELIQILTTAYPGKDVLTGSEAARYLHISESRLASLRSEGAVAYTKTGGHVYFAKRDLDAYMLSGIRHASREECEAEARKYIINH